MGRGGLGVQGPVRRGRCDGGHLYQTKRMMAAMPHLNLVKHRGEGHRRRGVGCGGWLRAVWMGKKGVDLSGAVRARYAGAVKMPTEQTNRRSERLLWRWRPPAMTPWAIAALAGGVACAGAWAQGGATQGGPAQGGGGAEAPANAATPAVSETMLNQSLAPFEGRAVRQVEVRGLKQVPEQLVRNQLRTAEGRPMRVETVQEDLRRLNRLGRFRQIDAKVQPFDDRSVAVIYELVETPVINDVQAVGNREISDQELGAEISILAGTPVDRFQLDRALRRIKELYKRKGYYQADVTVDEKELEESGIVLFRIREGERLKITDIRFEGAAAFSPSELRSSVRTKTWSWFDSGALDDIQVDQDISSLVTFYKDRGYLDVRVDRIVRPSPDGREAILTFLIEEGQQYTMRSVRVELDDGRGLPGGKPPVVFSPEQLAALMLIKPGDVYSMDRIRKSVEAVGEAYGKLGYVNANVIKQEVRNLQSPEVDLMLVVSEGRRFNTGLVVISGNELTQQKVIRREIKVYPDRPLDAVELRRSERRIRDSNLFERGSVRLTIQPEDPANPGTRDVLAEVAETNTGSLAFGAAVNSDAGLIGQITLNQRNFDLYDTPDSWDEFFSGRAFRGGGQTFSLSLQPGTEVQNYTISLAEPNLLETDYSGSGAFGYRVREFDEYEERRTGGQIRVGRSFGELWSGVVQARFDGVDIRNVPPDSITDIFAVKGYSNISGLGLQLRRSSVDRAIRPSKGSVLDLGVERVGALMGDYDFTKLSAGGQTFITVAEDFLGRKTILSFKMTANYIPEDVDEVPIFERYFLGGREFRGFRLRGVSPRGVFDANGSAPGGLSPSDDPAGGTWAFFLGTQIEQPVFQDIISVVGFVDSGTVTNSPGFDDYRVSVGAGIRLYLPQLGPAPLAFDFAVPIKDEETDKRRVFSFSLDIPF